MIATPIFASKKNGTKYESVESVNIIKQKITAMITYITISWSDKSIVSNTMAVILLIFSGWFVISLNSLTASIVFSSEVEPLNVTTIIVEPFFNTLFVILSGNISTGIVISVISWILITFDTSFISFILSSSFNTSLLFILSTMTNALAPDLKSSFKMFWPCIVSISSGK